MVNVSSRIPFNLHNQNLPSESWFSANPKLNYNSSRSTSRSDLVQTLTYYHHHDFNRNSIHYRHPLYPGNPHPRLFSSSQSPDVSPPDSPDSPELETSATYPRPNPILNVRLVGFEDQSSQTREYERQNDRDSDIDNDRDADADRNMVGSASTVTQSHIQKLNLDSTHDYVRPIICYLYQ